MLAPGNNLEKISSRSRDKFYPDRRLYAMNFWKEENEFFWT